MSDKTNLLYEKYHDSMEKYTYYILGITVVSIGFIISNNMKINISLTSIPLGLSVLILSISFWFGLKHLAYVQSTMYANFELLKIELDENPSIPQNSAYIDAASKGIRSAIEINSKRSHLYAQWENRLMILGMLSYFIFIVLNSL